MRWMILPLKRYFEFSGRSCRREYWLFALLNVIVVVGLVILMMGTAGTGAMLSQEMAGANEPFGLLMGGFGLALMAWGLLVFIPSLAVTVRRFHDRDMSGWWYAAFIFGSLIPFIGFLISIGLIVLMALPGTAGPNRFGPDPRDPAGASVFE